MLFTLVSCIHFAQFRILGADYRDALLEVIERENLPAEYGGACECGLTAEEDQPRTVTCVSPACTLTKEQMLQQAGYRQLRLDAGGEETVGIDVKGVDGTAIVWYFHTEEKDVVFSASFEPLEALGGGASIQLVAEDKRKSHKDWYVPESAGRFSLRFSNKHSRFTSKVLYWRLSSGHTVSECRVRSLRPFTNPKGYYVEEVKHE